MHCGEPPAITGRRKKARLEKEKRRLTQIGKRFIAAIDEESLPVPWHRSVRPTQTIRFLIHILLTMGYFVDEYELFSTASIRESFIKCHLLNPHQPEESARTLMRNYFFQQLKILPVGTKTFDRCCVVAFKTFWDLFVNNSIYCDEIPTVLYCQLHKETDAKIMQYRLEKQDSVVKNIISKLTQAGVHPLPSLQSCLSSSSQSPTKWDVATIQCSPKQPESSVEEQRQLLQQVTTLVDRYSHAKNECTQNICIVGAGGVGKTTSMMMALLYARTCMLTVGITAYISERAQELAGDHVNFMFGIIASDKQSTGQMAERAISHLYRKPERLHFLQTLDVLGLDELGSISAEYICIIDIILRYIRESNKPFGGMLIISTMDHLQIDPCKGKHALLCPLIFISSFQFHRLTKSVRAAKDETWQRIQEITRLPYEVLKTREIKEEFISKFTAACSFLKSDSSENCPKNALYVYGKNAPIRDEEKRLFAKLKHQEKIDYIVCESKDEERSIEGRFHDATDATSDLLNFKTKEPRTLFFFEGARYQITFNNPGLFSNSQIAILTQLPSREDINKRKAIKLSN